MGKQGAYNVQSVCSTTNFPTIRSATVLFFLLLMGLYLHEERVAGLVSKLQSADEKQKLAIDKAVAAALSKKIPNEVESEARKVKEVEKKADEEADETLPVTVEEEVEDEPNCRQFISYNKPVKTGSTSVFYAIRRYLHTQRQNDLGCGSAQCLPYAYHVCAGTEPLKHSLGHLHANLSTLSCLREKGYYMVTSIRDPYTRWRSVYLYNRQRQGNDYGIPWNISFQEFVEQFNPCSLFKYYEREKLTPCEETDTDEEIDARVKNIVDLFDDVIELGAEPVSDLQKRIAPFVGNQYVSDRSGGEPEDIEIDPKFMRHERMLYDALKKKKSIPPGPGRSLCHKFPENPDFWPQRLDEIKNL